VHKLNLLNLALQNLRRKPYRSVVISLCVAVATGSLFVTTLGLRGVQNSLVVGQARLGADLVVVPEGYEISAQEAFITGEPTNFYMDGQIAAEIVTLPGVRQTASQVYVQTLTNARCCIGEFFLIGFDPETDFTIAPWLSTHSLNQPLGPFEIIVGDRILLRQGDGATFYGTEFRVAGVLEKTGMGIDRTIYVPMEGLRIMIENSAERAEQTLTISPQEISSVLIKVDPGADVLDVAEAIEGRLDDIQVFTASHLNQAVGRQMQGMVGIILSVTAALWLMSLLTIGLVFSLIVNERQRELGLLRAMGARRGVIFRLVMGESALLSGFGGLVGSLFASLMLVGFAQFVQLRLVRGDGAFSALSRYIQLQLNIPYLMPRLWEVLSIFLILLLLALLSGIVASLHPAFTSSRLEPYAAIRKGE